MGFKSLWVIRSMGSEGADHTVAMISQERRLQIQKASVNHLIEFAPRPSQPDKNGLTVLEYREASVSPH